VRHIWELNTFSGVAANCEPSLFAFATKVPKASAVDRPQRAVERRIPLPSQRGAKPDQERNEINGRGPPPAGRMPFMSDSTLIRRSAALRKALPVDPASNSQMRRFLLPRKGPLFRRVVREKA